MIPGEIKTYGPPIICNADKAYQTLEVLNRGDRPVQIGSHFHFFEVNDSLIFDRKQAFGYRLNIPAGTAVRFEPGDAKTVDLVALGGKREVYGLNFKTNGALDKEIGGFENES
ncbi:hypothetical protein RyT2_12980 [Pseudolactococcus yaeyamensis]